MTLIAFTLACTGMLALCLAMPRHHRDLFNTGPGNGRRILSRLLGTALLIGCIAGNVHGNNAAIGLVIAVGQIMLAGLMVGLGLAWSMARKALRASS